MKKRIISIALTFALILALVPAVTLPALASESHYTINATGTISNYTGSGGHVVIPPSIGGVEVKSIGLKLFQNNKTILSVTMPDTVTLINYSAFQGCTAESVTLSKNVRYIGEWAFADMPNLKSIVIPDNTPLNNSEPLSYEVFKNSTALESVILPKSLTAIDKGMFSGCTSLKNVNIPEGVTSIGNSAFADCTSLTSVILPSGLTTIGMSAFARSGVLISTLPDNVTSIESSAFFSCKNITAFTIPKGVTVISTSLFDGCSNLTEVVIPDSVTTISRRAFYNTGIKSVTLPASITTVGLDPFPRDAVIYVPNEAVKAAVSGNNILDSNIRIGNAPGGITEPPGNTPGANIQTGTPSNAAPTYTHIGPNWAIKTDGSLWHWGSVESIKTTSGNGDNIKGQFDYQEQPIKLMDNVAAYGKGETGGWAGNRTYYILQKDGSLWGWGRTYYLGIGGMTINSSTSAFINTPVKILDNVVAFSAGEQRALAVKADGSLWGWGFGIGKPGIENMKFEEQYLTAPVQLLDSGVKNVYCTGGTSLFLKADNSLWEYRPIVYDRNSGKGYYSPEPVKMSDNVRKVVTYGGSYVTTLVIKNDNTLWGWGWNDNGQIKPNGETRYDIPIKLYDDVKDCYITNTQVAILMNNGDVWVHERTEAVKRLEGADRIFPSGIAIKRDGTVWAFAHNSAVSPHTILPYKLGDNGADIVTAGGTRADYLVTVLYKDSSIWHSGIINDQSNTFHGSEQAFSGVYGLRKFTDGWATSPMTMSIGATPPASSDEIKVFVNGTAVIFDQPPIIQNGRTLVPLRAIFEALGAEVSWEQSTQTVTATRGNIIVTLTIGSNILNKNGQQITLDVPAQIIGGRTLVPARAVAESFGADVGWNQSTRTVTITE